MAVPMEHSSWELTDGSTVEKEEEKGRREEKKNQQITKKSQEDGKANNDFAGNAYDNKQLQSTEYR